MSNMPYISAVIPVYNEESNLKELTLRLTNIFRKLKASYEIIFVDDGSSDDSVSLLRKLKKNNNNIKIIKFSRNFGHHIAISAGLDYARGEKVIMMDADLQHLPEEIPNLLKKSSEGYNVVYGIRKDRKDNLIKIFTSWLFVFLISKMIKEKIIINSDLFRIMDKKVIEWIKKCREKSRYIVGLAGWVGFKQIGIPIKYGKRFKGKSSYTFTKMIKLAFDAIFSFSNYPLKIAAFFGFLVSLIAFILGIYYLIKKIVFDTAISGWTTLIVSIFFLGGIQLIVIGILGEYIGRIYIETKNRPLYIVEEEII